MERSSPSPKAVRCGLIPFSCAREGFPEVGKANEVVVGEAFAKAHGFQPGDSIEVILRGAKERLMIVGIGLSPEYVFEARPERRFPTTSGSRLR